MNRRILSTILEALGVLMLAFFVGSLFGLLWAVPVVGAYFILLSYVMDRGSE